MTDSPRIADSADANGTKEPPARIDSGVVDETSTQDGSFNSAAALTSRLRSVMERLMHAPEDEQRVILDAFEQVFELQEINRSRGFEDDAFLALMETSRKLLENRKPRGGGLTQDRAAYLISSGAFSAEQLARAEEATASGALERMEDESELSAISDSLSTRGVARLLDVDESSVRSKESKGLLLSFLVGTRHRYPSWQFIEQEQELIPHLAVLIEFIASNGLHHSSVQGMMTNRQDSLVLPSPSDEDDEVRMTPVEWLVEGNDPQAVLDLFSAYLAK